MKNIVHITSVHKRNDIRIFLKECVTLAQGGYNVTLVVADGLGDENKSGVRILDAGMPAKGRLGRMLGTTRAVYRCAKKIDADLYHFHDPELIPVGVKLKRVRPSARVVFDSHENYADDIEDKPYIRPVLRPIIAGMYRMYERMAVKRLDAVVAATPSIRAHFERLGVTALDVNNFPFQQEFTTPAVGSDKKYDVAYIGAISEVRGVSQLVEALPTGNSKTLIMAGSIADPNFESRLKSSEGWAQVKFVGQVDRAAIKDLLSSARVAAVTFLPAANHIESQPNKMFEYMSAGLPVIASNFPLWKEIIEGNNCGICVDPLSPQEISRAVDSLVSDPTLASSMGENGRQAVLTKYNWDSEGRKLITFYAHILEGQK
ncbi:glycosyltransferase family 4 protein [Marinobacter zhejiangensis]|uniref:Glycosyltransferase involved in cell wall bisynthesis n=1 Tax=Marinobacter zhejiangensis TaxID=488535 RepID=A0A1I4QQ87_9GAMM|nr:glycosyltransferase family 4 protein [Marinobacter zhejiangensis]SFM42204.1 Glycosyltransferase involved in cell wall bisynthesis [Marinobacter zhejiangensis]